MTNTKSFSQMMIIQILLIKQLKQESIINFTVSLYELTLILKINLDSDISEEEMIQGLRLLYLKAVKGTMADDDFETILNIFHCSSQTLYFAKKKLQQLVNISDKHIDMCVNSCLAFTGEYSANSHCAICNAPRFN